MGDFPMIFKCVSILDALRLKSSLEYDNIKKVFQVNIILINVYFRL